MTLVDFVTNELSGVPGVMDSETSIVLKSFDFWVDARRMYPEAGTPGKKEEREGKMRAKGLTIGAPRGYAGRGQGFVVA